MEDKVHTLIVNFSKSGPRSAAALLCPCPDFALFLCASDRLSTSDSTLIHASSTWPSAIFETTCGLTLSSSTTGPSPFSTALRFSRRTLSAVDRA